MTVPTIRAPGTQQLAISISKLTRVCQMQDLGRVALRYAQIIVRVCVNIYYYM